MSKLRSGYFDVWTSKLVNKGIGLLDFFVVAHQIWPIAGRDMLLRNPDFGVFVTNGRISQTIGEFECQDLLDNVYGTSAAARLD